MGHNLDGPSEFGTLLQQSAQFNAEHGGGSLTTLALISQPSRLVGEVNHEDARREALVDQIVSLCDDTIPLDATSLSHVHAVPVDFASLTTRSAQPCQPATLRTYVRRAHSLLHDVRACCACCVFVVVWVASACGGVHIRRSEQACMWNLVLLLCSVRWCGLVWFVWLFCGLFVAVVVVAFVFCLAVVVCCG